MDKKILILFFCMILLVGTVSALEIDNVKSYDSITKTITIKNTFGIDLEFIGLAPILETATLKSNTYECGQFCSAEKEITIYEDGSLINGIRFYRLDGEDKYLSKIRNYELKYYGDVPDFEYFQKDTGEIYKENNSKIFVWDKKQVGSHKEWISFGINDKFNAGTYLVKLEGEKRPSWSYDWQIDIQGKWTTEWATWGNISTGDQAEVRLINPDDKNVSTINTVFYNATANVTGGAGLTNMSLWTNASGTWDLNETKTIAGGGGTASYIQSHNQAYTNDVDDTQPLGRGFKFVVNQNVTLIKATQYSASVASTMDLYYSNGTSIINSTITSKNASFNVPLIAGETYWLCAGGLTHSAWKASPTYPYNDTYVNFTNGVHCDNFGATEATIREVLSITVNATTSTPSTFSAQNWSKTIPSGNTSWNVQACDTDGACGFAVANRTTGYITTPLVDLNSPANNSNFNTSSITFNISVTDTGSGLSNVTLFINDQVNESNTTGYNGTYIFNKPFSEGDYNWSVTANNTGASASNISGTRYFIIDTLFPSVNTTNLTSQVAFSLPINSTWILNATDPHLQTCYYNTSENPTYNIVTCNSTISTTQWTTQGNKLIQFCANDTFGHETCGTKNITITSVSYSQSDNPDPVGEGGVVSYFLEVTVPSGIPVTTANLWFNGVIYSVDSTTSNSTDYFFTKNLTIPNGVGSSGGTANDWAWNYTITGVASNISTSTLTTTVYSVEIDDCSVFTDTILNFSLKEEEGNTFIIPPAINGSNVQVDLLLSSRSNPNINWSYSNTWLEDVDAVMGVCVPTGLLLNSEYRIDLTTEYIADGYVQEFFFIDNGTIDSSATIDSLTTKNITLYDLLLTDSTTFLFNFLNDDNLDVPNAIVHVFRDYIGDGVFREIERGKQDDNGETHLHLVEEDVIYYFVMSLNGNILYTSSQYNAKCQEVPCVILLSSSQEVNPFPTDFSGLPEGSYTVDSNRTNRSVTLNFNLNETKTMNLSVYRLFGNSSVSDILVGTSVLTASSGAITVGVPELYGNVTFYAVVYSDSEPIGSKFVDLTPRATDIFPEGLGVFLAFCIIITLGLAGASQGYWSVIFMVLGFILTSFIKLLDMNYTALIFLICLVALVIYKIKTR